MALHEYFLAFIRLDYVCMYVCIHRVLLLFNHVTHGVSIYRVCYRAEKANERLLVYGLK